MPEQFYMLALKKNVLLCLYNQNYSLINYHKFNKRQNLSYKFCSPVSNNKQSYTKILISFLTNFLNKVECTSVPLSKITYEKTTALRAQMVYQSDAITTLKIVKVREDFMIYQILNKYIEIYVFVLF